MAYTDVEREPLSEKCSTPPPDSPDSAPAPLWQRAVFLCGQIFLGTLHVILVHSSTHKRTAPPSTDSIGTEPAEASNSHTYKYSAALVVLLAELLKFTVSLGCFLFPATKSREAWDGALAAVRTVVASGSCLRFGIPAVVYMLENHIRFAVLKELESPVTWVVFSHTEIPIVALMTTVFLGRRLSNVQWVSVILLVDGVMASQVSICESQLGTRCEHLRDFPMAALCMVLLSATMAATAGTVCEWLFKETYSTSIHLQNAQLYVWGCLANAAVFLVQDRQRLRDNTVWHGFDARVLAILVTLALQGLCVAAVVKHMSNVAKVFASAVGLFVAAIMSAVMDSFDITLPFALATVVVVCALYVYHLDKESEGAQVKASRSVSLLDPSLAPDKLALVTRADRSLSTGGAHARRSER